MVISAIPISILIPYNRNRLLKNYLQSALELNTYLEEKANPIPKVVHLKSDYDKALEFYKNAFEIAEGLLDDEWISKIQNSMEELNRIKSKKDL